MLSSLLAPLHNLSCRRSVLRATPTQQQQNRSQWDTLQNISATSSGNMIDSHRKSQFNISQVDAGIQILHCRGQDIYTTRNCITRHSGPTVCSFGLLVIHNTHPDPSLLLRDIRICISQFLVSSSTPRNIM